MAKKNRFADQAALQTLVRFGPQLDALKEAQRTAESTFDTSVSQAKSGAQAVQQAVDQARPQVQQIYGRAGLDQARTNTLVGQDLAALGPIANSIKGGAALEAAGMLGRLGESRAAELTSLGDRRVQAAAGGIQAQRAAQSQLVTDLTKILQARKDLGGQQGAFQSATIGDLQEAARARANARAIAGGHDKQGERNSVRSSGIDPDTGLPIPGGKLDPKARKKGRTILPGGAQLATANEHGTAKDSINQARTWIRRLSSSQHLDEATIKDHLVAGDTLTDASDNKLKLPEIAADYVQAAWESENAGGVSPQTAQALHDRGLSIKQLGLMSRGSSKGKARKAPASAFGPLPPATGMAQALAQALGG